LHAFFAEVAISQTSKTQFFIEDYLSFFFMAHFPKFIAVAFAAFALLFLDSFVNELMNTRRHNRKIDRKICV